MAAPVLRAKAAPLLAPRPSYGESAEGSRRWMAVGVLVAHLLLGWGLMQMHGVRRMVAQVAPVVVRLIAEVQPAKPLPPPPPAPVLAEIKPVLIEVPMIATAAPPAPSPVQVAAVPVAVPVPVVVQPQPASAPAVAATPPPAPQVVKQIPASAVRYLREPRMTVPLLSRRLRESGIVQVRVLVDVSGRPKAIALHKSSGFARLDQQALQDMLSARFVPQTENGQPIEWEVIAPMSYEVDR